MLGLLDTNGSSSVTYTFLSQTPVLIRRIQLYDKASLKDYLIAETQNTNLIEYMHPYAHCSIIYNRQDLKAAQVPISRRVDKKAVVRLHSGIPLGH